MPIGNAVLLSFRVLFPDLDLFDLFVTGITLGAVSPDRHDFANLDIVDIGQQCPLALDLALGKVQPVHSAGEAISAVSRVDVVTHVANPGMFKALINCDSLVCVDCQHAVDEIKCWVADRIPVGAGVVETTQLDLLRHCVGVLAGIQLVGKGREPAETDV